MLSAGMPERPNGIGLGEQKPGIAGLGFVKPIGLVPAQVRKGFFGWKPAEKPAKALLPAFNFIYGGIWGLYYYGFLAFSEPDFFQFVINSWQMAEKPKFKGFRSSSQNHALANTTSKPPNTKSL